MSAALKRAPAPALPIRSMTVIDFFKTMCGEPAPNDAASAKALLFPGMQIVSIGIAVDAALFLSISFVRSLVQGRPLDLAGQVMILGWTILLPGVALFTVYALIVLAEGVLHWRYMVRFEAKKARRREAAERVYVSQPELPGLLLPSVAAVAPVVVVPDEMLADLENYAIQMREDAFNEAARIAYILNRIHLEIFDERQER